MARPPAYAAVFHIPIDPHRGTRIRFRHGLLSPEKDEAAVICPHKTASFLAGGEVPIPVASGLGQTSVTYKSYGVKLAIKPVVDIRRHILAGIQTAISQINPALTVNGYPAFLTRKTSAVVNVKSGQTIVLSGLVHTTGANTVNKFPWLGDIHGRPLFAKPSFHDIEKVRLQPYIRTFDEAYASVPDGIC